MNRGKTILCAVMVYTSLIVCTSCVSSGAAGNIIPDADLLYPQIPAGGRPVKPCDAADLSNFELQIPGGKSSMTIGSAQLCAGYESRFLTATADGKLRFSLSAKETGTTPNTTTVRSELRHTENWTEHDRRTLRLTVSADLTYASGQFTVAQIHKVHNGIGDKSPVLRMNIQNGCLIATIKDTGIVSGSKYTTNELCQYRSGMPVSLKITAKAKTITIFVNGEKKLEKTLLEWPKECYFKAGCYLQSHNGFYTVYISDLEVL